MVAVEPPQCPYCSAASVLVSSLEVYSRDYGPIYLCRPCKAWVGCHKGTTEPLGRLADAELRKLKMQAHEAFDPLWKSRRMTRRDAYAWLAKRLKLSEDDCHIGMFDAATCREVVRLIDAYNAKKKGGHDATN